MNLSTPQDRTTHAGEYVLGTLSPEERAEFESALAYDAALRAEVYQWQDRLLGLALTVAPAEPRPSLWPKIESRLASDQTAAASPERPFRTVSVRRLRWWQAIAGLSLAASIVLATALGIRLSWFSSPERYVTILQTEDRTAGWIVEVSTGDKLRLVPIGPMVTVPPDRSLQFWTKLDGAAGPTSLGLVTPGQALEIPLTRLPGVAENQLFELTLEPRAGSPIDRPTGPILYVGRSVRL